MEQLRKPFQGVWNIIRFNWHFYALAILSILILLTPLFSESYRFYTIILAILIFLTTLISLIVSFYVYDLSDFYKMDWLDDLGISAKEKMLNINAGFDETSVLLKSKFPSSELLVFDFYDPTLHTEVSIKRARLAYPPFPNTQSVKTKQLPLDDASVDQIFLIFAAHEIRLAEERNQFFKELNRILKTDGQIVLVEHLRDLPNLLAYNLGFFHFMPLVAWKGTFESSQLYISNEKKMTAFVSAFILEKSQKIKHGITS